MENQARITDFIPQRPWVLLLLLALNVGIIGGLEWLYYLTPRWAAHTTDGHIAAFDLDSEGSLGAWYSSTILAIAAAFAFLVYSLRRHRIDDYRGRYRTWLLAGLCFAVMSIDESASLHEGFKEMMTLYTGHRLYGDGSMWWVIAYGLVLGWVGIRLLWDLSECRSALLSMFAAAGCFAGAVIVQLEFLLPESGAVGVMVEEGLEMLGNVLVWFGCMLYARHVVREIQGLVTPRKRRKTKRVVDDTQATRPRRRRAAREPAADDAPESTSTRKPKRPAKVTVEANKPSAAKPNARGSSGSTPAVASAKASRDNSGQKPAPSGASVSPKTATTSTGDKIRVDQAESSDISRLSKAERRALRKERRKQRH